MSKNALIPVFLQSSLLMCAKSYTDMSGITSFRLLSVLKLELCSADAAFHGPHVQI